MFWHDILIKFLKQSTEGDLKTGSYPKEWADLRMKVSFGYGLPARIPWIAFIAPEMEVSRGFYPVYLYYKDFETLILAYGVSETEEYERSWPAEIMNSTKTISAYFDKAVPRYGDSFVFKAYKVVNSSDKISIFHPENNSIVTDQDLESDLETILDYYKKLVSNPSSITQLSDYSSGLFYMEKQLEDFIIANWDKTELGKKHDLIIDEGELVSQQYKTDIGPIDILAREKRTGNYIVIELKKNKTSDETIGQIARYMGWIRETKKDNNVKGIIIAGNYDRKLEYALKVMQNIEVFIYEIDFKLKKFTQ